MGREAFCRETALEDALAISPSMDGTFNMQYIPGLVWFKVRRGNKKKRKLIN